MYREVFRQLGVYQKIVLQFVALVEEGSVRPPQSGSLIGAELGFQALSNHPVMWPGKIILLLRLTLASGWIASAALSLSSSVLTCLVMFCLYWLGLSRVRCRISQVELNLRE